MPLVFPWIEGELTDFVPPVKVSERCPARCRDAVQNNRTGSPSNRIPRNVSCGSCPDSVPMVFPWDPPSMRPAPPPDTQRRCPAKVPWCSPGSPLITVIGHSQSALPCSVAVNYSVTDDPPPLTESPRLSGADTKIGAVYCIPMGPPDLLYRPLPRSHVHNAAFSFGARGVPLESPHTNTIPQIKSPSDAAAQLGAVCVHPWIPPLTVPPSQRRCHLCVSVPWCGPLDSLI